MLPHDQSDRLQVVLVSPRNPLNIGAAARAMANFGFARLSVVAPYAPHWREARSAVGAPELLQQAREFATLSEAVADCAFVAGTGTLTYRKAEQRVVSLPELPPMVAAELAHNGRVALVFGSEKSGLTREDLSWCQALVEIPTDARQPSMNLGQAVAVCLYEISTRTVQPDIPAAGNTVSGVSSGMLDRLAELIGQTVLAARYSPATMAAANRHDLRLLLRRLQMSAHDARRAMGYFRHVLRHLQHSDD